MFFRFPLDARWNPERSAVEFGIGVGDYEGVVRVPRLVFQQLLSESPTPERCLEAYHLHRTRLELIAERRVSRKQLTDDANVEITGAMTVSVDAEEGERPLKATGRTNSSGYAALDFDLPANIDLGPLTSPSHQGELTAESTGRSCGLREDVFDGTFQL